MNLTKRDFEGVGKVLRFTLVTTLKNKSNIISVIILMIMAAVSVPLTAMFSGGTSSPVVIEGKSAIEKVYVSNSTPLLLDGEALENDAFLSNTDFSFLGSGVKAEPDDSAAAVNIYNDADGYFVVDVKGSSEAGYAPDELFMLGQRLEQILDGSRFEAAGASPEQLGAVSKTLDTEIISEKALRRSDDASFGTKFAVQYIFSIFVMVVSIMASSYIIRAIIEEKASRLVELLMVSVKPLALVLGKILAIMIYVFGMMICMLCSYLLSRFITGMFMDLSGASIFGAFGGDASAITITPMTVLIVFVSLLLGYLTFSIISGIGGACCSTMEDMQYAQLTSMVLIMGGYIISCISPAFSSGAGVTVLSLLPVVSIFCAPVFYAFGNIGFGMLCLSWLLQAAVIALLALLCARVYNDLLIHRGSRVKLSQLFAMAKQSGKGEA